MARDSIGKTGNVDNTLVCVKKLWLTTRAVLGLDDQCRKSAMRRCQTGSQTAWSRSDNDDVPKGKAVKIQLSIQFRYFEIRHCGVDRVEV